MMRAKSSLEHLPIGGSPLVGHCTCTFAKLFQGWKQIGCNYPVRDRVVRTIFGVKSECHSKIVLLVVSPSKVQESLCTEVPHLVSEK